MRLIDIDSDEYSSYLYYPYNYEVGDYEKFMVITDDDVQSLRIVEAIPIEWIEQKMKELDTDTYEYEWLIAQWRIENYGKTD